MRIFFLALSLLALPLSLSGYKVLYAEQFYRLYHLNLYLYPDDTLENIFYLEQALRSDFANPLNALAKIDNKREWEKYRYLFYMHVNLKLIESHLQLANKYDKKRAFFYNSPWQKQNQESLKKAQEIYSFALSYWSEVQKWSSKASSPFFKWLFLEEIQNWEDENGRIQSGLLDYKEIIEEQLERVQRVLKAFDEMDSSTY